MTGTRAPQGTGRRLGLRYVFLQQLESGEKQIKIRFLGRETSTGLTVSRRGGVWEVESPHWVGVARLSPRTFSMLLKAIDRSVHVFATAVNAVSGLADALFARDYEAVVLSDTVAIYFSLYYPRRLRYLQLHLQTNVPRAYEALGRGIIHNPTITMDIYVSEKTPHDEAQLVGEYLKGLAAIFRVNIPPIKGGAPGWRRFYGELYSPTRWVLYEDRTLFREARP